MKVCFPVDILGSPIWVCGLTQILSYPSMFRMSAKVVLLNYMILDMSGSDVYVLVANVLVSSWLDNCNSLFRSLSMFNLHKLQITARIVSNTSQYISITPALKK